MKWYCYRTLNKKEMVTSKNIYDELGLEVFCPRISQIRKTRNGKKRFTEALFPCYAFAKFDIYQHLHELRFIRGVSKVLKFGSHIPSIPDEFVYCLREKLNSDDILFIEEPKVEIQKMAQIQYGPFRTHIGRIINASNSGNRICILLDLLGQKVPVKIPSEDVTIIDSQNAATVT